MLHGVVAVIFYLLFGQLSLWHSLLKVVGCRECKLIIPIWMWLVVDDVVGRPLYWLMIIASEDVILTLWNLDIGQLIISKQGLKFAQEASDPSELICSWNFEAVSAVDAP